MLLSLAVFFQTVVLTVGTSVSAQDTVAARAARARADTMRVREDSIRAARDSIAAARRRARVIPVTPEAVATAFATGDARMLLLRARSARLSQDSALRAYDATTYERMSIGLHLGLLGRERLLFRTERSTHVQWARDKGAAIDITGRRSVAPMFSGVSADLDVGDPTPIPYVPGQNGLWVGVRLAKADIADASILDPLANGAEAYYTYHAGDSVSFQLPGGPRIVVRELRVRPRTPRWNAVVGSLWFDVSSGQLVRAIYRLSTPMDVVKVAKEDEDEDVKGEIPLLLRPLLLPMRGQIDVITVDYGLFEGHFWLPRTQTAQGSATIGAMHAPIDVQQRFDYTTVNGDVSFAPAHIDALDTTLTVAALERRQASRDSACKDTSASWQSTQWRFDRTLPVSIRVPCDSIALTHAKTLPASPYDNIDTLFASADQQALIQHALGLGSQAGAAREAPDLSTGMRYARYNRIEGLSLGAEATQELGNGYRGDAQLRVGTADGSVTGALSLARSNGRQTRTVSVYRRLDADNDWDNPFTLSASLSALLFGRDQGQYYRSWGAELTSVQDGGWLDQWRLFGERESSVRVHSTFSLPHLFHGDSVTFRRNIDAQLANEFGLAVRRHFSVGEDPSAFRMTADMHAEGATGTFDYVRGMVDMTLSHPLVGPLDAAWTVSGGTSGGTVPVQRLWYLGGVRTLAGQPAGVFAGDAYWFTRLEVGAGQVAFRPVLFGDLGWAGDRTQLNKQIQPAGSVGLGWSMLDGLLRLDLAKGIRPERGIRGYLYLDARF